MPKTILCITTKHKTLLYYKQLKEISVNSNLSLVILAGVYIYIMYIAYIVLLQYKQLMELLVFSMVISERILETIQIHPGLMTN